MNSLICSRSKLMKKPMFRRIIAALFAGTIVTGLTSNVYAQSSNGATTLTSESLRGLQNREASKDFPSVFSGSSRTSGNSSTLLLDNNDNSEPQVKPPIRLPEFVNQLDFSTGGSTLNSEEVFKLRYRLLSPTSPSSPTKNY